MRPSLWLRCRDPPPSYTPRAFPLSHLLQHRATGGERMIGVLGWMLFGLIVGALAKLLMPGRDPGGIIVTMAIGIVGALVGGWLGRAVGWYGPNDGAGYIVSILGAILLLWIYRMIVTRRTVWSRR